MASLQMPDDLSSFIQDFVRPEMWRHANQEHKYFMNILNDEMKYLNEITEELIEDGLNIDELAPTSDLLLSHLGYELLAEPEERPVVEAVTRQRSLNWAWENYGEPFKQYDLGE